MAFDGFTLKAVIAELQTCLIGGRVDKVYQPIPDEIILKIYANGINYALSCNVSSSYYMHLTTKAKPNPDVAPNFCMLLRKHLIGFKVKSIYMLGLERVATIELEGYNEFHELVDYKFIVELMGKHSNIILVNQNNIIVNSLKHLTTFSGSYRDIIPNTQYILPELEKINFMDIYQDFEEQNIENLQELEEKNIQNLQDLDVNKKLHDIYNQIVSDEISDISVLFTNNFAGVSRTLLDYAISKLAIDNKCDFDNFKKLIFYFVNLIKNINANNAKLLLLDNDYVLDCSTNNYGSCQAIKDNDIEPNNLKVNFFLDDYYFEKEQVQEFIQYRNSMLNFISKKLKKIAKKLEGVNGKIQECSKMPEYKLYGELLTSNLYKISNKHADSIVLENYYSQNEPITIPLDIALSPSDNAKKYFKKYHKLKNTIDIVTVQKNELESEINYLESIVYEIQIAKNTHELDNIYQEMSDNNLLSRKTSSGKSVKEFKFGSKKFAHNNKGSSKNKENNEFLKYNVEGFTVLVGRSNVENDFLTMKVAKQNDLWFHVKDLQGSHVILVVEQKEPSQEIINKVAAMTAYYSKAKQSSNVPVDYTLIKYVKKVPKSKPGMVIYTNQKTVNVQPKCI